jgi:hypothetical protein
MIEIGLQELYNIISVVGFGFCMYKIRKLETVVEVMKTNQLLSAMTSFAITKTLKDKGLIDEIDENIFDEISESK